MGEVDTLGAIRKKSSELRSEGRCRTLRRYDKLNGILDTLKEGYYDDAILVKDIMKGYLQGEFAIKEFRGLVEQGLDDNQMFLPEQKKAKIERLLSLLTRAALSESRKAEFPKRTVIREGRYEISVSPDAAFRSPNEIELVLYRVGKPTVTQKGKKRDASVNNSLELYFLLRYARTMVPVGETWTVKASYYFMRKTTDKIDSFTDQDFFSGNGGNVVTLEEQYLGGSTEHTKLDEMFLEQLEAYDEGDEECAETDCKRCKMYTQCYWLKNPELQEKKTNASKKGKITPSDAQQAVIDFRKGYCKVNAGAGTGKTECMTERGARMFEEGVDPKKMLFITFTDAGAAEMKERLAKKAETRGLDIKPEDIQAMTFNAFDYRIIKDHYGELGFREVPKVIDRVRSSIIITEILDEYPVSGLDYLNYTMNHGALVITMKVFDIIKTERIDPNSPLAVTKLQECLRDSPFPNLGNLQDFIRIYRMYDKELRDRDLITYSDQEPLANRYLDAHPSYLEEKYGYEHIVVDEFQDSNDGQLDKIKRLCACGTFKSLMVVGDDSQAIYSFRHTSPDNIIHFFEKMEVTGTELFLTENRRSVSEVIDFANGINDLNKEKVAKTMVATRPEHGKVTAKGFFKKADEYSYIAHQIQTLIENGTAPEDIAFIAFTRDEISEMSSVLSNLGIPWVMKNPLLYMNNGRVNAAIALAMCFYDPESTKGYFDYLVAKYDGELFANMDDDSIVASVDAIRAEFEAMEDLPFPKQREIFHRYLEEMRGTDEIYASFLDLVYDNEDLQSELEYIMDFRHFGEREEKKMEQSYQGVVLVTAHSSKGLEWKYVFNSISKYDSEQIHKINRRTFERLEEMRRLIFVSGTRARDELTITGQYIAFGTKEEGYTENQFLRESYHILGEFFDPVDHEKEKKAAEAAKKKGSRSKKAGADDAPSAA